MISEETVRAVPRRNADLDQAADALIHEANEAGGRDNITVVLFRLEEVGDGDGVAEQETIVGIAGGVRSGRSRRRRRAGLGSGRSDRGVPRLDGGRRRAAAHATDLAAPGSHAARLHPPA